MRAFLHHCTNYLFEHAVGKNYKGSNEDFPHKAVHERSTVTTVAFCILLSRTSDKRVVASSAFSQDTSSKARWCGRHLPRVQHNTSNPATPSMAEENKHQDVAMIQAFFERWLPTVADREQLETVNNPWRMLWFHLPKRPLQDFKQALCRLVQVDEGSSTEDLRLHVAKLAGCIKTDGQTTVCARATTVPHVACVLFFSHLPRLEPLTDWHRTDSKGANACKAWRSSQAVHG